MTDSKNNKNNNITGPTAGSSSRNKNKPICVLCDGDVPLYKMEEDFQWRCPNCRKVYQLYFEVMAYESDFSTVYGEEEENQIELAGLEGAGEPVLLTEDDNNEFKTDNEEEEEKGKIPIPKYMKDGETTKVTYYREE